VSPRTWTRSLQRGAAIAGAASLLAAGLGAAGAGAAAADTVPTGGDPQTVSADALPTWQINGVVWSQAIVGNTVYVAGSFTKARPPGVAAGGAGEVDANNAFAYDITTGNRVASFHPQLNAQANVVFASPDGSRVYFGGDFTTVDGVAHAHLAAFATATNTVVAGFAPNVSARVSAIATTASTVYVGGMFGAVNGTGRSHLAAFNATTGALTSWAPTSDDSISSMVAAPGGARIIIGGRFTTLNGVPAWGMGAVDPTTGTSTLRWDANLVVRAAGANGEITSLRTDGVQVYGSGYKFKYPGSNFEGTFGADPATGKINFVNDCHGDTYDIFPMGKVLYSASHAHECEWIGGFPNSPFSPLQHNFGTAFTTYPTGVNSGPDDYSPFWSEFNYAGQPSSSLLDWFPSLIPGTYTGQGQAAWSLTGNSTYVSYGGEFVNVSGTAQQGLVRFALPSTAPNKVRPVTTSVLAPVVTSQKSGAAEVTFSAAWDRDNTTLTYRLYRDASSTPIYTTTLDSTYWQLPTIRFEDTGLAPGSSHTYHFTATDPYGNASGSPASSAVVVASSAPAGEHDFFGRSVSGAWGSADVGGAWTPTTDPSAFGVSNGVGTITLSSPGANADSALSSVATASSDVVVGVTADKLGSMNGTHVQVDPVGVTTSSLEADVVARRVAGAGDYRAVVRIASDRLVWLSLVRVAPDGTRTVIAPESIVQNVFWTPGMQLVVHLQALGAAPTTVQASVWAAGTPEPATWQESVTDATAGLQGPGSVALGAALGSTVNTTPLTFSFDDLSVGGTTTAVPTAAIAAPSCTLLACSFDGTASADTDGSITSYAWSFGDGTTGTGSTAPHTFAASGTYPVTLTVTDDKGAIGTTTRSVTVTDAVGNLPPNAVISAPACTNLACSFSGSTSSDPDGSIASYAWTFGDGGTATGATPSHTYAAAGTFTVGLTVTDDKGATGTVSTSVTVSPANVPPTAVISAPACTNLACSFSGSTSSDPDGSIASYAWTFGDGGTGTGATPSHTYAAAGTFTVGLTVTDNKGATSATTTSVTVAPANVLPTAVISAPACTNLACSFSGSTSSDPDGSIASYAWTFGDGGTATGATPSHTYAAGGSFAVTLTVTDNRGGTNTVSTSVTVAPANVLPTAVISAPACTNLVCSFSGSTSNDPDGSIASYAWTFGDGGTATGATASHTYAAAGTFAVTLKVTDNRGGTNTVSTSVTVTPGVLSPFATDAFTRTVPAGWGTADLGGAWTVTSTTSLTVSGGAGLITLAAASIGNAGYLNGISSSNTDLQATVTTDKLATTSGIYVSLIGRHVAAVGDYRVKVRLATNGAVGLSLLRTSTTGVETALGGETIVSGLTYTAGTQLRVRLQVTGTGPTALRARLWKVGTVEPATWTVSTTDATAGYQVAGSVGVFGYLSKGSTAPVVIRFDDVRAAPAA
jgi:PKD repeat protein